MTSQHRETTAPSITTLRLAAAAALAATLTAHAAPIQGPTFILASTTMAACAFSTCAGFGQNINEIADGSTANLNGWAGQTGLLGTIKLDLLGSFDLDSFSLWNDVNVSNEGVRLFRLHFYDTADQLLVSTGTFAAGSQFPEQLYTFATVSGASRVDLEVLSASGRIEIREVAFNGEATGTGTLPEPGAGLLAGLGLALMGAQARLRRG